MMYSLDSPGLAHMSAPCQIEPSSIHDMLSGAGRLNDSPRYPYSSPAKCFTKPSRLVPVGVIGRRRSYSFRPSSLDNKAAPPAWSLPCNSCFRSDMAVTSPLCANPHQVQPSTSQRQISFRPHPGAATGLDQLAAGPYPVLTRLTEQPVVLACPAGRCTFCLLARRPSAEGIEVIPVAALRASAAAGADGPIVAL